MYIHIQVQVLHVFGLWEGAIEQVAKARLNLTFCHLKTVGRKLSRTAGDTIMFLVHFDLS